MRRRKASGIVNEGIDVEVRGTIAGREITARRGVVADRAKISANVEGVNAKL
jgi:hypothetical protein